MPFSKIKTGKDKGKYKTPSGRVMSSKQIRAYHATKGFNKPFKSYRTKEKC